MKEGRREQEREEEREKKMRTDGLSYLCNDDSGGGMSADFSVSYGNIGDGL